MIKYDNGRFILNTAKTSYIFEVNQSGHLEHIYWGPLVELADADALRMKNTIALGTSVDYSADTPGYSLDNVLLEYSGIGKGDYRHAPTEILMPDGSFISDFVFSSYSISDEPYSAKDLPTAYGNGQTLTVELREKKYPDIIQRHSYTVFEKSNVICRNVELINEGEGDVIIRKLMSFMMDIPASEYDMITFDGTWAKETHMHRRSVESGILVNDSTTGGSSNRHNPGFIITDRDTDYERGRAYGFNLIYSGNHYSAVERAPYDTVRIMSGINPHCFLWKLKKGESFVTPQAVMSFAECGINSLMENMHSFVNEHVVRGKFKDAERPIVLNNWEATFFNFNRRKIHSLAGMAKKLGVEMFVLDDGWFGARNNDRAGLGDWKVNEKKLPGGIKALAKKINKMGMKFGLWFEPECINADSDLYRAHPDWVIRAPEREGSVGRNQYVLDLTRTEVRDYIVNSVDSVLNDADIEYVKWDYNRHISDAYSTALRNQGEFFHRYILGLYDVLHRIFHVLHPDVMLESCSSGGNRFDLGMLCYSVQIWTSDNTDPIERLDIQSGIYCLYPQSAVSNHVSMAPHQQTLRDTPLSTRFNVSAFGVLGYELDFNELTPKERSEIKEQISFYKQHRRTFQYGSLKMIKSYKPDQKMWQIYGNGEIFAGIFQTHASTSPSRDILKVSCAEVDKHYHLRTVKQYLRVRRFGSLIKHITPIYLHPDGIILRLIDRHYSMTDGVEQYSCSGRALRSGINLQMQYEGTGYNGNLRMLGDFGSNLYMILESEGERNG